MSMTMPYATLYLSLPPLLAQAWEPKPMSVDRVNVSVRQAVAEVGRLKRSRLESLEVACGRASSLERRK